MEPLRIVIGGVNGTGKSTFACSLLVALQITGVSVALHELDVYSDTHGPLLGLKPWDQRRGRKFANYKHTIRPAIDAFEQDEHAIVIGDLPGKVVNPWLGEMVAKADQAILVGRERVERDLTARHPQNAGDWEAFYRKHAIPVMCRVQSMLSGQEAWEGTISAMGLNRALQPHSISVQEVTQLVLRMAKRQAARSLRAS